MRELSQSLNQLHDDIASLGQPANLPTARERQPTRESSPTRSGDIDGANCSSVRIDYLLGDELEVTVDGRVKPSSIFECAG